MLALSRPNTSKIHPIVASVLSRSPVLLWDDGTKNVGGEIGATPRTFVLQESSNRMVLQALLAWWSWIKGRAELCGYAASSVIQTDMVACWIVVSCVWAQLLRSQGFELASAAPCSESCQRQGVVPAVVDESFWARVACAQPSKWLGRTFRTEFAWFFTKERTLCQTRDFRSGFTKNFHFMLLQSYLK